MTVRQLISLLLANAVALLLFCLLYQEHGRASYLQGREDEHRLYTTVEVDEEARIYSNQPETKERLANEKKKVGKDARVRGVPQKD